MPQRNGSSFQAFVDYLSTTGLAAFKILVLNNSAFHHAKYLEILANSFLVFLPLYSSKLNSAEKNVRH